MKKIISTIEPNILIKNSIDNLNFATDSVNEIYQSERRLDDIRNELRFIFHSFRYYKLSLYIMKVFRRIYLEQSLDDLKRNRFRHLVCRIPIVDEFVPNKEEIRKYALYDIADINEERLQYIFDNRYNLKDFMDGK